MKAWVAAGRAGVVLAALLAGAAAAAQTGLEVDGPIPDDDVVVIAGASAGGLPADRVPASIATLDAIDLDRPGTTTLSDALSRRLGSVSAFDSVGNPLQQGLNLRGYTAAPILGEPQGVVVFQGPMRVNEAFGDVVQWDLLPAFAIRRTQVVAGSNPAFGLNGIGGAVTLGMKNGLDDAGTRGEALAGSFGRLGGTAEHGGRAGGLGYYLGVNGVEDDGWRDFSPSRILRGYADLAWASGNDEVGLGLTAADSQLTGNGPAPADLLAARRRAVFTHPDRTDSRLYAAALRVSAKPLDAVSLSGGAYYRRLERSTANGDQAEFEECGGFVGLVPGFAPPAGAFCFGAEVEDDGVEGDPEVLVGPDGRPIARLEDEPDAVFNRTRTTTDGWGISAQASWTARFGKRENILIVGGAADGARTRYRSGTELGGLRADRGVDPLGVAVGNDEFNVRLRTRSALYSLYASNTLSLTPSLHLSASLRWNRADLRLRDGIGTALDGDHRFSRVNPGAGLTWNASRAFTAYASYAENNRIPTPAELSCADPERPCRFPNAFLADPPLDDVRARTFEAGVRGRARAGAAEVRYSAALFTTTSRDDIIFISAGPIVGTGYFDNIGSTRRRGVEANLDGRWGRVSWYASYALVDATFRTPLTIQAPDNPGSGGDGEIAVGRGDRLPNLPRHGLKLGADLATTDRLTLGVELVATSSRPFRGDEANLQPPVDGFALVNARASYRAGSLELFARVENVFAADYETFGIFGEADELGFGDPRFLSPGAPRTLMAGVRSRF